jgi:archaellum component FlaC
MAAAESPQSREFRQMRHDVDDVYRLLAETHEAVESGREAIGAVWNGQRRHGVRLEEIQQALDLQNMRMDRMEGTQHAQGDRLGRVEGSLGDINQRLNGVDERFDGIGRRFDGVDERFDGVDERFDGFAQRFDGVDKRFDGVDKRFDGVAQHFDGVGQRFDGLDGRLERIEGTQQQILDLLRERSTG